MKTKLDGIASGATANATNAELRDRTTHTGEQAISTVTGLQTALDGKEASGAASTAVSAHVAAGDPHSQYALESSLAAVATTGANADLSGLPTLGTAAAAATGDFATAAQGTDAREWTATTVTQAEAEAGTATTRRAWTAERIKQAILALAPSGGGSYEVATFADLPDPTTVTAGRTYTVLGALCTGGTLGTQWASDGTIWRPVGPQTIWLNVTDFAGTTGGSATEEILAQIQIPANVLSGCRSIQIRSRYLWSGTDANTRTIRIRLGTAGTTSDTVLASVNNVATNNRQWLLPVILMPRSATSVRHWGVGTTASSQLVTPDQSGGNLNSANDLTVPTLSQALWLSFTHQSGASPTTTATLSAASLILE
jgi:hypothetical protein